MFIWKWKINISIFSEIDLENYLTANRLCGTIFRDNKTNVWGIPIGKKKTVIVRKIKVLNLQSSNFCQEVSFVRFKKVYV